jgi:hypothetical protein
VIGGNNRIAWLAPRLHPNAAKSVSDLRTLPLFRTPNAGRPDVVRRGANENDYVLHAVLSGIQEWMR